MAIPGRRSSLVALAAGLMAASASYAVAFGADQADPFAGGPNAGGDSSASGFAIGSVADLEGRTAEGTSERLSDEEVNKTLEAVALKDCPEALAFFDSQEFTDFRKDVLEGGGPQPGDMLIGGCPTLEELRAKVAAGYANADNLADDLAKTAGRAER